MRGLGTYGILRARAKNKLFMYFFKKIVLCTLSTPDQGLGLLKAYCTVCLPAQPTVCEAF
jgi:hypothetical protein